MTDERIERVIVIPGTNTFHVWTRPYVWTCGSCWQPVPNGDTHYCPCNHGVRR